MRFVARAVAACTTSFLLVGLAPVSPASALSSHITGTTPTNGTSLQGMPGAITVQFDSAIAPPGATLTVTRANGGTPAAVACTMVAFAPGDDSATCNPAVTGIAAPEDTYTVRVQATVAGPPPAPVDDSSYTFKIDRTAPALASSVPTSGGTERPKASAGTVKNGYVATAGEALRTVAADGAGAVSTIVVKDAGSNVVPGTTTTSGSSVSFVPTTALSVGSYTADVTLVDRAGNSATVPTRSFAVNLPPAPTSLAISPNPYKASSTSSPISVTGVSESAGDSVLVTLSSSGGGAPLTSTVTASTGGSFGASFSGSIGDGTLTATATTTDVGGNTGPAATATSAKDVVLPAFVSSSPADGASEKPTTGVTPNGITVVASEALHQTSSTLAISKGGVTYASTRSFPTSTSIKATPVDVLPQGTYTATITLVDLVGNSSSVLTRTFVIDDTAPTAPSYAPAPGVISNNNKTAYTVTGTGEPGAALTLTLTDHSAHVVSGSATVLSNGTWTVTKDVSGLVDGAIALSATQVDQAGNTSGAAVGGTTKDTVAPRVSGTAFDKPVYKAASPITAVVTGTVDDGSSTSPEPGDDVLVTVRDGSTGVATGTGRTDSTGHFEVSVTITSLADGALSATAVATDAAGNASSAGTATSSKDTGLPATPTVTMTNPVNAANAGAISVSGTTEALSTVLITIIDQDNATGPVQVSVPSSQTGSGTYALAVDVGGLSDGTLTATVVATDAAGNASAPGTATATKDTRSPAAPDPAAFAVPEYVSRSSVASVPMSGTAEPLSTVLLHVTDSGSGVVDATATTSGAGAWSTTLDLRSLADGALSVTATARDVAGNPGLGTTKPSTKDTVDPGTPSIAVTPTALDYAHRAADVVVSGAVAPADNGAGGLVADITISDGPGTAPLSFSAPVASNSFSHTFLNERFQFLPDTLYEVRVQIRDAAGNTGVSAVTQLRKDVTKLAVAGSTPAAASASKTASSVVVTFNEALVTGTDPLAPPYSALTVKKGGITLAGSQLFTNGSKTLTFTPPGGFADGVYDVFVHATDAYDTGDVINDDAGTTPTFSFTVDSVAPVAPTVTSVTDPVNSLNQGAVVVSGNAAEQGLTVTVTITGTSGSVSRSATSGAGGAYAVSGIPVGSLPDGTLTATAASTDAAGNAGPAGTSRTTTKETVLPTVSGLTATATRFGALTSTVRGTLSEAGTVALSATDGTHTATGAGTVAPDKSFSGTLDLSSFSTGSVTVTATATDTVGNVGPAASATTTHDASVPPAAPAKPTATAGDRKASVAFTAPANGGAPITSYTVTAFPGGRTGTGASSPVVVTGLTNGVDYTFTVVATNRAGTSTASPASDVVTPYGVTSTTLNALPSKITYGTYLTLAGVVHRSDSGAPFDVVGIFTRTDSGVVRELVEVPVSSTGAWSYRVRPSGNLSYKAVYFGDDKNDGSLSVARRVLVAVKVTVSAPAGSHTVNQVISGAVLPKKPGKVVYLYKVTSTGSLVKLKSATLSSTSTYRFSVRLPAGSTKLRVVVPATPNNAAGSVTFTAKRS